jgi:hypothetical protein
MKNCATRREREERFFDLNIESEVAALRMVDARSGVAGLSPVKCGTVFVEREREDQAVRPVFRIAKKGKIRHAKYAPLQTCSTGLRRGFF